MLLQHYGLPVIVALNRFGRDTEREFEMIRKHYHLLEVHSRPLPHAAACGDAEQAVAPTFAKVAH